MDAVTLLSALSCIFGVFTSVGNIIQESNTAFFGGVIITVIAFVLMVTSLATGSVIMGALVGINFGVGILALAINFRNARKRGTTTWPPPCD
jgi:hypothetical protein